MLSKVGALSGLREFERSLGVVNGSKSAADLKVGLFFLDAEERM